jgi:succinoglycan biosynthesis protein ExoO
LPPFLQYWPPAYKSPSLPAEPDEAPIVIRAQNPKPQEPTTKGHVLFVSRQRIAGRTNGSSAYLLDLAEAVRSAGFTPHLLQPSPDLMGRWPIMRLRSEMGIFQTHKIRGVLRFGQWVVARDPRVGLDAVRGIASRWGRRLGIGGTWIADRPRPYAISANWTRADRAFVKRRAPSCVDIVIADYAFQAEALDLLPACPSAIVMHDLFHGRAANGARDSVASLDRATEIALLSRADAVIAIQSAEARFLADHVSTRPILAKMAVEPVDDVQLGDGNRLLFVGSNTAPNVVGLKWMFESVWPRLRERSPELTFDIVGAVAAAFPRGAPPGVVFHGMADDLAPFYTQAGIVVSPLTFGSGLKIKLVEALAQGKAVVATSVTLQGVERECEGAVAHADEPEAFADAVLALADDRRRLALAESALAAARDHFSPRTCHAEFTAWLEDNRPRACRFCRAEAAG